MSGFWITPALQLIFSTCNFNDPMLIDRGPDATSLTSLHFQSTPVCDQHQEFLSSIEDLKVGLLPLAQAISQFSLQSKDICESLATLTAIDSATAAATWID